MATCTFSAMTSFTSPILLVFLPSLLLILINIIQKTLKNPSTVKKTLKSSSTVETSQKNLPLPPGGSGWPVIGEAIELAMALRNGVPERFMRDRREKYTSDIFRTTILGMNVVVLSGRVGNKFLFSNENKLVKTWWPPSAQRLFGPCLLTYDGERQTTTRNMMTSFVNPDALSRVYISTIDLVSQQHIKRHWKDKRVVEVFPTIKLHWFELACRLFMGAGDADKIEEHAHLFNVFLKGLLSIPFDFPGTRFHGSKKANVGIKRWLLEIVRRRRTSLQQETFMSTPPSRDLLSHMLVFADKNGAFMSELEIANNLHVLIMAGHDVSIAAITMLMKKLAEHPDIYDQVLKEQQEIASTKMRDQREFLQWEDIQKMRYSWNTILESMRMSPPIMVNFREAITDINYQGYRIPKGWKLCWSATLTHNDPKIYPNPENFDPSRFERDENCSYSYIAFGGGPRMCLGKEFARVQMLVFLHNVITRFKWKLADPNEKMKYDPVGMPEKGSQLFSIATMHDCCRMPTKSSRAGNTSNNVL